MKNTSYVQLNNLSIGETFMNMNDEQYIVLEKYENYIACGRIVDIFSSTSAMLSPHSLVKRTTKKVTI